MAKFQGFIGSGRGKAGNIVFSKGPNGTTIAKAYQPQVKNPRTDPQLLQRGKMNVVGQFSALCTPALLAPMGMGSKLANRSAFTRSLLHVTTATMAEGGGVNASFAPSDVKFSRGTEELRTTAGEPVVTASSITLTLTPTNFPAELIDNYGERIVVGILDDEDNAKWDRVVYLDHIVTSDSAQQVTIDIAGLPLEDGQTVVVWRLPFTLISGATGAFGMDIHIDDSRITAILATSSTTLVRQWGETTTVAIVPFVPVP